MTGSTSKQYDYPWEDTLILAFRDMQWIQAFNNLTAYNKKLREAGDDLDKRKKVQLEKPKPTLPPLLAKLDGHAENSTADVISSSKNRYFLLEFKSDRSKIRSESDKFIHHLMSEIKFGNENHAPFETLSRNGHFFIYAETPPSDPEEKPTPDAIAFGEGRALGLKASPYIDEIRKTPDNEPFAAEKLLHGSIGWEFPDMLAYLETLTSLHGKVTGDGSKSGAGRHPMKVAIATQNGLFWPYSDLSDVLAMTRIFGQNLATALSVVQKRYDNKLNDLKPIANDPHLLAELIKKKKAAKKPKPTNSPTRRI
ncbi:hypothetical protein [Pseudomonas koreensis]|uniref:Uncharacterized protein n=1 Tax=Pseudomonas koreensis TaxID=198620 RepID=A0A9X2XDK2_9PSED|nr:hypothetical protein [Pseudomonas koreensis]MCU7246985.1 hypothetical protein [Pseudomonas koreensis]